MITKVSIRRRTGLGDFVEVGARPIAMAIDKVLGTSIADCGGCEKRRVALNEAVPNVNPFTKQLDQAASEGVAEGTK